MRCAAARSHSLAPEGRLVDGNTHKMALDIEASPCAQTGDLCAPVWAGGRRGAVDARVHTRHHRQMEWAKGWPLHCAALEEARACGGNAGHCKAPRERGGLQCGRVPHPAPLRAQGGLTRLKGGGKTAQEQKWARLEARAPDDSTPRVVVSNEGSVSLLRV